MTSDLLIICKAVSKSDKIQLNDDSTKVKRITQFVERDISDIDARTVYVECLPRTVNHEWMEKVFSECGIINYISLPKFKSTGDQKGFGFVEFDSRDSAAKACELLNNPPIEVGSRPGRFPKSNKQLEQLKKNGVEEMIPEIETADITPIKQRKHRHRNTSESSVDGSDATGVKQIKRLSVEGSGGEDHRKSIEGNLRSDEEGTMTKQKKKKKKKKNRRSQDATKTDEESDVTDSCHGNKSSSHDNKNTNKAESDPEFTPQVNKQSDVKIKTESSSVDSDQNRKRKRRSCEEVKVESDSSDVSPQKRKRNVEGSADACSESDQVTDNKPKKKSRNSVEFSDPVVQNIKHLKRESETVTEGNKKKKRRRKKKKDIKEAETLHLRVLPKIEWLGLRKEYLKVQKCNMSELKKKLLRQQKENKPDLKDSKTKGDNKAKQIEFLPDVIVKVESRTPLEKQHLREMFDSDVNIAYIDLTDGNTSGYIRCKDGTSAKSVVNSNKEFYRFTMLAGEDEKCYWKKLELDRENKLNNKNKTKKRGVHKLIDKAQKINTNRLDKKHVFFED